MDGDPSVLPMLAHTAAVTTLVKGICMVDLASPGRAQKTVMAQFEIAYHEGHEVTRRKCS
jgi:hypothetical protein